MRRDLPPIRFDDEAGVEQCVLTSHRTDVMRDRTRTINLPRAMLISTNC